MAKLIVASNTCPLLYSKGTRSFEKNMRDLGRLPYGLSPSITLCLVLLEMFPKDSPEIIANFLEGHELGVILCDV